MSETASFNLVDEPWISVIDISGGMKEVSLLELFRQASQLKCLSNDLPTQDFAILRVLLAILQRAVSPMVDELDEDVEPSEFWSELWGAPELPLDYIEIYLEKWHNCFDLFDEERPFMQVPNLKRCDSSAVDEDNETYIKRIIADVPSRKVKRLFSNRAAMGIQKLSYSESARWLIHTQAFDTSGPKMAVADEPKNGIKRGKTYADAVSWCGKIGCLYIEGSNLRDTLLLNFDIRIDNKDNQNFFTDDDLPLWEVETLTVPQKGHTQRNFPPNGRASLFTWQTRWIRLIPNNGFVTNVVLGMGDKMIDSPSDLYLYENMTGWRILDAKNLIPNQHNVNQSLWRGLHAVFGDFEKANKKAIELQPPGIKRWLENLNTIGDYYPMSLHAVGFKYDESMQSSYIAAIDDDLKLDASLFSDEGKKLILLAYQCIDDTKKAINALTRLAINLFLAANGEAKKDMKDNKKRKIKLPDSVYSLERQAYAELDGHFRQWFSGLSLFTTNTELARETAREKWRYQARMLISAIAKDAILSCDQAAVTGCFITKKKYEYLQHDQWMNVAIAESKFNYALKNALPLQSDTKGKEEISIGE